MMREVNLLNNGNANLLVPKSEVLSAEATFDFLSINFFLEEVVLLGPDDAFLWSYVVFLTHKHKLDYPPR